jgi:hypothetical protein
MSKDLPKIPSEYIEPYLQRFLTIQIEGVGIGMTKPEDARNNLKGVKFFVSCFGGIHASLATQNVYWDFINMSDEQMIKICKEVVEQCKDEIF